MKSTIPKKVGGPFGPIRESSRNYSVCKLMLHLLPNNPINLNRIKLPKNEVTFPLHHNHRPLTLLTREYTNCRIIDSISILTLHRENCMLILLQIILHQQLHSPLLAKRHIIWGHQLKLHFYTPYHFVKFTSLDFV